MAEQTFLIKIKKQYRAIAVKRLCDRIHQWRGRILLMTDAGYLMIVSINDSFRNAIQAQPEVSSIGGVQITPKQIRHIRVDQSGRLISSQNIAVQTNSHQQGG